MASCLKKTLTILTAFVRRSLVHWRRSRLPRSFVSDDRMIEIRIVFEAQRRIAENAGNSSSGRWEVDVDQRAEVFIDDFRRQLRLERQISLHYRVETEYEERWPPPPPISPPI
ncbi:unnamed protein product [Citrullus colocynthis]|uniref:Uncharacterized protein n=1 Tax=Citrullus colocynthis TaxID=252529 RepID=A0ABP0YLP9_9ROSI